MNKHILTLFAALLLIVTPALLGQDGHDHDDDDHEAQVTEAVDTDDGHEGHDHEAETAKPAVTDDGHDHEEDELFVELTPEAMTMAGITVSRAAHGRISRTVPLAGEVGFNEDRLVHIAPRFAGIAVKATCRVGDYVEAGQIVAVVESNESMNAYSITAPISGWVIERHITPGEYISGESSIFVIADLSTVWVNLAVYAKDADRIKPGLSVHVNAIGSDGHADGTIEYVTPVLDVQTRRITARVVLPNPDNAWRPGTFVQADVVAGAGDEGLVVERDAVQLLDDKSVVFVSEGPGRFVPIDVEVGANDARQVRVLSGISEGTLYVSSGAFEIKAAIVTRALGGHAGHGH